MKGLKIFVFVLGAVVLLLLIAAGLALTPAVQTWAVRKAVAGQPGLTIEVGRVDAGLSAAAISDLRVVKDGMVLTAKSVTARYSAWDYLAKKRINADQFAAEDVVVDLRNAGGAPPTPGVPAAGPGASTARPGAAQKSATPAKLPAPDSQAKPAVPPAFAGVLQQAKLPFDLRIARLAAKGRALLSQDRTVTFDLQGTGLETGQRGKLEWTILFTDAQKDAALRAIRLAGSAGIQIAADRRIDRVEIDVTATANGPKLPRDQMKLEAKIEQPAPGGDESYSVRGGLVRDEKFEPVLTASAQYQAAAQAIAGTWNISLRTEQLTAVLAGLGLPDIALNGSGKFTLHPQTSAVASDGTLEGRVSGLEKLSPALAAVGTMQFKTSFDGGFADQVVRIDQFQLDANGADGRKLAEIKTLQKITYALAGQRVTLADPKAELARVALVAVPLAWAQPVARPLVIESGELSLVLALEADADGSHVRVRALEPVALRSVTIRRGKEKLIEQVSLTANPKIDYSTTRVLAELADLKLSLPAGDALTGTITAEVTNLATVPAVAFNTQLQAKIVSALKPYLPLDPGPLSIVSAVRGRLEGQVLQLAAAATTVNRESGGLLVSFELQQSVVADLKKITVVPSNPTGPVARLRVGQVPLAWAEALVPKSKFTGQLAGASIEITARSVDDLTLRTVEPLLVQAMDASIDGKPMAQALDLSVDLTATKHGDVVAYDVRRIELKQGSASLATLTATGEARLGAKRNVTAKGTLEADVGAVMAQPALAPLATLSRGKITTAFEATIADTIQARVTLASHNLVAKQDNRPLGDLELSLNAVLKPDGNGTVVLPLTLTNGGRKSDVKVEGSFGRTANAFLFDGKITSSQIVADDFQPLAGLAPSSETPEPQKPAATRDAAPFWGGAGGKVELDLKKVLYGRDYAITGIRGKATITGTRLALEGLEGRFKENPFKATAGVTFNAQQPKPYSLSGTADVSNFDVGEILRAANPNDKPAMETKVTVTAKLNGNGATLPELTRNVYGQFDVAGTPGVLRALGRKGQGVSAVSSLIGIVGALRGSDTTVAVSELASAFNEMKFDSFKMHVERAADLNLKVTSIEFISALMRITGTGGIANQGTAPIQDQPMRFDLQLGAKDHLALLLNKSGILSGKQDEKGYSLMSQSFTVGGTASKPDASSLWSMIGGAAARAAASALLR